MEEWVQKYETGCSDFYGKIFRAKFYFDGYAGDVTTYQGGGDSIEFGYLNESDDVFGSIRASDAKITIKITDFNFVLGKDLYSSEPMNCLVKVFDEEVSTTVPCFVGYVDPTQYQEAYDVLPYDLNVVCVDGLILLKDIPYYDTIEDILEDSGSYYDNRMQENEIVLNILAKIGYYEYKEFINIYEINMNSAVQDSPMDQLRIDNDVFNDMTCEEVLIHIASKYNAWVIQWEGIIHFIRPVDLVQNIIYGRYFTPSTSSGGESTAVSFYPALFIQRSSNPSLLRQVPGGGKMMQNPVNKVNINQDYGNKESWINNWELKADQYDDVLSTFKEWTTGANCIVRTLSSFLASEQNGCALQWDGGGGGATVTFEQLFGGFSVVNGSDKFIFEIDYNWYNDSSSNKAAYYMLVSVTQGSYWLRRKAGSDTLAEWTLTPEYLIGILGSSAVPPQFGDGWVHFKREFYGLPGNGDIKVYLNSQNYPPVWNCYKDIKFYTSSYKTLYKRVKRKLKHRITARWDGEEFTIGLRHKYYTSISKDDIETIVQHTYIKQNNVRGKVVDYDYILGDIPNTSSPVHDADVNLNNIVEQFKGSLAFYGYQSSLILTASNFVIAEASTFLPNIILTCSGGTLIFTASVPGVNFTNPAAITNLTGTLDGTESTVVANSAGVAQVWEIPLTGGSGSCTIDVGVDSEIMVYYGSSMEDTIDNFISVHGADYSPRVLTRGGDTLIITGVVGAGGFEVTLTPSGITGTPVITEVGEGAVARVDHIVLSGSTGTATVYCDDYSHNISMYTGWLLTNTTKWNTRSPGGENKPLLEIIGDEIAKQYSRPKQLIQMPIQEMYEDLDDEAVDIRGAGWNAGSGVFSFVGPYRRWSSTGADLYWNIYPLSPYIIGATHYMMSIRYKVERNYSPEEATMLYSIDGGHGFDANYAKHFTFIGDNEWHILLLDMSALSHGGNDWITHTITGLYVSIVSLANNTAITLAWLGFVNGTKLVRPFNRLGCYYDDLNVDDNVLNIKSATLWTTSLCTFAAFQSYMRYTATGEDSHIRTGDILTIDPVKNRVLSIRYRVVSMESATGGCQIYWKNAGHGRSTSYCKQFDLNTDGFFHTLLLDMTTVNSGGTDWTTGGLITQLWFELADRNGIIIDLEWLGFSTPFVINRGSRNPRNRTLDLDLVEIIT